MQLLLYLRHGWRIGKASHVKCVQNDVPHVGKKDRIIRFLTEGIIFDVQVGLGCVIATPCVLYSYAQTAPYHWFCNVSRTVYIY